MNDLVYPWYVDFVKSLDDSQKTKIYSHYLSTMLELKHNSTIVDKLKEKWKGKPDKECFNISFYQLWKDLKIRDFRDFISEDNMEVRDLGENWKKNGFAKRYWIEPHGIYEWYCKFNDKICIVSAVKKIM